VDEGGNPVGRDGSDDDDHAVATGPGLDKVAFTSEFTETDSELSSTPFELTVGEEVTYRYTITLPEIDLDSVVLTDQLPAEMEFVSVTVVSVNGTGATGTVATTDLGGNAFAFDFGAMTNASDGAIGLDDTLVFDVTARILSDGSVGAGDDLTNTATLEVDPAGDDPFAPVTDDADVTVVEPLLEMVKDGPAALDPGDIGTYSLTITNVGDPAGPGPAFDLTVGDTLPPELVLDPASLSYSIDGTAVSPTAVTADGTAFSADFPLLDDGSTLVITYTATLDPTVTPVSSFINTANVTYYSVPGDPVDESGDPVGETYTPVTDEHVTSTGPTLTKEPIATQFTETEEDGDGDGILGAAIGEEVTYALILTLPEIAMDSVVLTDLLPTGLTFVSAAVVDTGSEVTINGATDVANVGQLMTVTLSDVVNTYVDGTIDATQDTITVEVVARVVDIPSNVQDTQLINSAGLVVTPESAPPLDEVTDMGTVEVIEPQITIDKSTNADEPFVGDTILYTVVITNDATATAPAFNTVVTDNLPFELTLTGNTTLSDPTLGSVSPTSVNGATSLIVTIPVLQPGESLTIEYETFVGFNTDVLRGIFNTATYDGGSTPIADDPNGRSYIDEDTAIIVPQPVPGDDDERRTQAIDGIDDAQFLPILLIDPIYTGTAEPGSNVTVNLYKQDGSLDYVRNIVADTGGHWIAIFPRVQLEGIDDRFHEEHATSVLFDAPVKVLDRERLDSLSYRNEVRTMNVESNLIDEAYTLGVTADRPSTLPDSAGMYNTRTFFAPAHVGEIYGTDDVLKVDEIFDDIAFNAVQTLYAASADPLGASLNRFNYEFLASQTAVPGQQ
ncbi:MAG: isopeptide-forming domain-containing fimbrial protein, partial [Pseudomonadota bacterium]